MKLAFLFRPLFERRKNHEPVLEERRNRNRKDIDRRLKEAISEFETVVGVHKDDPKRVVANDRQQTVIFSTFREVCRAKGPELGRLTLCRHRSHPDAANSALSICDEDKCPILVLKGAA